MKLSRYKRNSDFSYTLGATLTYELFRTQPNLISRVFLRPQTKLGEDVQKIISELKQRHIPIVESSKAFNVLGAKDNCILIAEFTKPQTTINLQANHIVLVNPSDAGNLGTIMRSAVGFGYENLAIISPAVDHFDPKVIRASMGAFSHLNISVFESIEDYLLKFPNHQHYSFMLRRAKSLPEALQANIQEPYSLIFGNEAAGLPDTLADITNPVFIPQNQKIDSLNLSVAASIAMYLFSTRQ